MWVHRRKIGQTPVRALTRRAHLLESAGVSQSGRNPEHRRRGGCRRVPDAARGTAASAFGSAQSQYVVPERPLSAQRDVEHYNNFYEFSPDKEAVAGLTGLFQPHPWQVDVLGPVQHRDDLQPR